MPAQTRRETESRGRRRRNGAISILAAAGLALIARPHCARAQSLQERMIDQTAGLENINVTDVAETAEHYVLATTQDGVYVFNGKTALPIGRGQNLNEHADANNLSVAHGLIGLVADGRAYTAKDVTDLPDRVRFHEHAAPDGRPLVDISAAPKWLVAADATTLYLLDPSSDMTVESPQNTGHAALLANERIIHIATTSIRNKDGRHAARPPATWYSTSANRICITTSGATAPPSCAQLPESPGDYGRITALSDGSALIRNAYRLYRISPDGHIADEQVLPDQDDSDIDYTYFASISIAANHDWMTQTSHGVAVRHGGHWIVHHMDTDAPITSIAQGTDHTLWIGTLNHGIGIASGFGTVENYTRSSGLSSSVTWSVRQTDTGETWVATDGGIDAIPSSDQPPRPLHAEHAIAMSWLPDPRTMLAATRSSSLCAYHDDDKTCLKMDGNEKAQAMRVFGTSSALLATRSALWKITIDGPPMDRQPNTGTGHDGAGQKPAPAPGPKIGRWSEESDVSDISIAPDGTAWTVSGDAVRWHEPNGTAHEIRTPWRQTADDTAGAGAQDQGFSAFTVVAPSNDRLWIGGSDGVYRLDMAPDHTVRHAFHIVSGLTASNVSALLHDRAGRIWIGTSSGVTIIDKGSMRAFTRDDGLTWNDVDQNGLYQAPDGTVWIATSGGITHVIDADFIFHRPNPNTVINRLSFGSHHDLDSPDSTGTLEAFAGAPGYPDAGRLAFIYGIDDRSDLEHETTTGRIDIPYIPPGRHVLHVQAIDVESRLSGNRIEIAFTVPPTRWGTPLAQAAYTAIAIALLAGVWKASRHLQHKVHARRERELTEHVERQTRELTELNHTLERAARTDGLTGLLNRYTIENTVRRRLENQTGANDTIWVMIFDLDHFKRINDGLGHIAGDKVLTTIASRLRESLSPEETCGRYGGEEFLVLLDARPDTARHRIEQIIRAVTSDPIEIDGNPLHVTASAGITRYKNGDSWEILIGRADGALYEAKNSGRNRICSG